MGIFDQISPKFANFWLCETFLSSLARLRDHIWVSSRARPCETLPHYLRVNKRMNQRPSYLSNSHLDIWKNPSISGWDCCVHILCSFLWKELSSNHLINLVYSIAQIVGFCEHLLSVFFFVAFQVFSWGSLVSVLLTNWVAIFQVNR